MVSSAPPSSDCKPLSNMNSSIRVLLAALSLSLPAAAHADDAWKGDASLGFLRSTGNSDTQSLNGKFELKHAARSLHQRFYATASNTSDADVQTGERYTAGYKLDRDFSEHNYLFGALDYERDLFGGVAERSVLSAGYGRRLINTAAHKLEAEIGAGYRQQENADGIDQDDAVGRLSGEYLWQLTDTNKFTQKLRVESGKANTFVESVSALKLTVVGSLYAGLSYTVRNNAEVPPGTSRTDTETLINLGYSFGF